MRPQYRILADSNDVTERIAARLIDMKITDEAGYQSDVLTMTLDDSGPMLEFRKGVHLEVFLGYQETGLYRMGEYVLDEPELSGPPDVLVLHARGADMRQKFKESKSRSWHQKTIGDIVKTVATEHEIEAKVASELATVLIEHIDQTAESDLHFLTRLAKEYDAVSKPSGPYLIFAQRNRGKSVSGKEIPAITIAKTDVTTYRLVLADRPDIGYVTAYWQDKGKSRRTGETVGDKSKPGRKLHHTYPNASEAKAAAKAELKALQRGKKKLDISMPGNPQLIAESPITLADGGWRDEFTGDYIAVRVEHRLSSDGFSTSVNAN